MRSSRANENDISLTAQEIQDIAQIMDSPDGGSAIETIRDYMDNAAIQVVEEDVAETGDVDLEGLLDDLPELGRPTYETAQDDQRPDAAGQDAEGEVAPAGREPGPAQANEAGGVSAGTEHEAAVEPTTEQTDQGEQTDIATEYGSDQTVMPGFERTPMTREEIEALKPGDRIEVGELTPAGQGQAETSKQLTSGALIVERTAGNLIQGRTVVGDLKRGINANNRVVYKLRKAAAKAAEGPKDGLFDLGARDQTDIVQQQEEQDRQEAAAPPAEAEKPATESEPEPDTTEEAKPAASAYGESNKTFTKDAAAAARERLKAKMKSQLSAGLDPELMQDGITLAGYHIHPECLLSSPKQWSALTRVRVRLAPTPELENSLSQ